MINKLINTLPPVLRVVGKFIKHNEGASGLSTSRFIQDTTTQLIPKVTFARSKADLFENIFLEVAESAIVYFLPAILGEKIFRKIFSLKLDKNLRPLIAKGYDELKSSVNKKEIIPVKGAIALTSLIIPLFVFTLNYFKNLITLKTFKESNFVNIASLESSRVENLSESSELVRNSAVKNILIACILGFSSIMTAALMAAKGKESKILTSISEFILAPGDKMFKKNEKASAFVNKYFSLDWANEKGKLSLSKGQLTACVLIGGIGYFGAAYDRGKENFLETLFRYPIVGIYVITGSELFEKGFKKLLKKFGKCKETINDNLESVRFVDLDSLAKKLAKENNTDIKTEYKKLVKQKSIITLVPFIFSISIMGFFVSAMSNLSTKLRYNRNRVREKGSVE